ncbi:hypothetical protein FGADI_8545 [Fusarium gaditjirri]|uniref:Uncharacterized protein n=1 Tax=Fusarium gaditjirri TaxID=282569 RepID=A0A8H4T249_9HYPO|nr:hypothetical protein FGADI_8545 [Fusarium gaditjirri]
MPPKPKPKPKSGGGDSLGGILIFGALYAVAASGIASLFEENPDKKDAKEEPKQEEKSWLERNTWVKEKGYYTKQVYEQFKDQKITDVPIIDTEPLPLTQLDREQAESMLKPSGD